MTHKSLRVELNKHELATEDRKLKSSKEYATGWLMLRENAFNVTRASWEWEQKLKVGFRVPKLH